VDRVVDQHGPPEAAAAVDDAVRDGVDFLLQRIDPCRLVAVDDVELQARRASVDDEYSVAQKGQVQSRTSG
jgi:hypothetical protein